MRTALKIAAYITAGGFLSLGTVGTAYAVPYGFASNQFSDFTLVATGGTATVGSGTRSTDNVAAMTAGGPSVATDPVSIPNPSDAAQAVSGIGPFPDKGTFTPSELTGGFGARADSETSDGNPFDAFGVSFANNVAETRGLSGLVASATGKNSAVIVVGVTEGTQIQFQFSDDVSLIASTDPAAGEMASASVQNTFQLQDGAGNVLFDFAPAGLGPRAVSGGTVTSDPFSLNQTVDSAEGTPPCARLQRTG
jgi:hypothetical protein